MEVADADVLDALELLDVLERLWIVEEEEVMLDVGGIDELELVEGTLELLLIGGG